MNENSTEHQANEERCAQRVSGPIECELPRTAHDDTLCHSFVTYDETQIHGRQIVGLDPLTDPDALRTWAEDDSANMSSTVRRFMLRVREAWLRDRVAMLQQSNGSRR
jgi:hypothetical protein